MPKLSQLQFIEQFAAKHRKTVSETADWVDSFKRSIYQLLAEGHSVELSGFGQFSVSHRQARIGVNPRQPSQKITIKELNTPKFKAGEAFKKAVALKY